MICKALNSKSRYIRMQHINENCEKYIDLFPAFQNETSYKRNDLKIVDSYIYFSMRCPNVRISLFSYDYAVQTLCQTLGGVAFSNIILLTDCMVAYEASKRKDITVFKRFNQLPKFNLLKFKLFEE